MPIAQRPVEPVLVAQSRSVISGGVAHPPETLPATSIITLTALIRQLGSLSKYADELFGEVFNEASKFVYRGNKLQERVTALSEVLQTKLKNKDVVIQGSIEMAPAEKPEQHILNSHMPRALLEQYHKCDKSPPLEIFARVRQDGQCSLQLYTDPSLFFKEWVIRMNMEANVLRNPNKKRSRRSRSSMRSTGTHVKRSPALPPVPQPSVYENRDIEDNIYEMLPDSPTQGPEVRCCPSPYQPGPQPLYPEMAHPHEELSIRSSLNSLSLDAQQYHRNPPPPPLPHHNEEPQFDFNYHGQTPYAVSSNFQQPYFQQEQSRQNFSYSEAPQFEDLPPPPEELLEYPAVDGFQDLPTPPIMLDTSHRGPVLEEDGLYDTLPPRILPSNLSACSISPSQFSPPTHSALTLHTPITPSVSDGKQSSISYNSALSQQSTVSAGSGDLLTAIRAGIKLKPTSIIPADKVPQQAAKAAIPSVATHHDVASILQRRKFLIGDISDGSSASESGSDWGDNDSWN